MTMLKANKQLLIIISILFVSSCSCKIQHVQVSNPAKYAPETYNIENRSSSKDINLSSQEKIASIATIGVWGDAGFLYTGLINGDLRNYWPFTVKSDDSPTSWQIINEKLIGSLDLDARGNGVIDLDGALYEVKEFKLDSFISFAGSGSSKLRYLDSGKESNFFLFITSNNQLGIYKFRDRSYQYISISPDTNPISIIKTKNDFILICRNSVYRLNIDENTISKIYSTSKPDHLITTNTPYEGNILLIEKTGPGSQQLVELTSIGNVLHSRVLTNIFIQSIQAFNGEIYIAADQGIFHLENLSANPINIFTNGNGFSKLMVSNTGVMYVIENKFMNYRIYRSSNDLRVWLDVTDEIFSRN